MNDSDELLQTAVRWYRAGRGVALATVISTWGFSPRPVGSKLVIDSDGAIRGPVGLGIGARTPFEIAISIMAEITAVLRRAPLGQRA
jgi:xanthine/CO dehydrogenase XdhC/CoxF family maturation factor